MDREIRAAVAKLRREAKAETANVRAYEDGGAAYWGRVPFHRNPYRKGDRRSHWERGWRDAQRDALEREARRTEPLTDAQRQRGRAELDKIKHLMSNWNL